MAADLSAYALVALKARLVGILLRNHLFSPLLSLLLLSAGLAFLAADILISVANALALIGSGGRFSRTSAANWPTFCLSGPEMMIVFGFGTSIVMPSTSLMVT